MGHELSTPIFHLDATGLTVKSEWKYFGLNLGIDTRNLFENHYKAESTHTCYCGHQIMMIEDLTGILLPKEPIQLYMAPINFHLIHGCEISPDSEDMHLKQLCKVQLLCIHRSNAQSLGP
jgi:kynurenine formamidase